MNNQRRAIYAERRRVLEGQDLKEQVIEYAEERWTTSLTTTSIRTYLQKSGN